MDARCCSAPRATSSCASTSMSRPSAPATTSSLVETKHGEQHLQLAGRVGYPFFGQARSRDCPERSEHFRDDPGAHVQGRRALPACPGPGGAPGLQAARGCAHNSRDPSSTPSATSRRARVPRGGEALGYGMGEEAQRQRPEIAIDIEQPQRLSMDAELRPAERSRPDLVQGAHPRPAGSTTRSRRARPCSGLALRASGAGRGAGRSAGHG